jgi:hypothetical protein
MAVNNKAFQVSGLVLKGSAESTSSGSLSDVEVGLLSDPSGNLIIKDKFVTEILKRDSITLKELYTRARGIYSRINSKGQAELLFKDDTVSRPYSLNEIVNACQNWRKFLTSGSLWWVGRSEIDHSSCANLPRKEDPDGVNVVWSIDRYLSQLNNFQSCANITPLTFADITTDKNTGKPRWWDVQNLEIVVPPIDAHKSAMIMTKLAFSSFNCSEPIMFRLFDVSTGVELTRTAAVQSNSGKMLYPLSLNYFGPIPVGTNTNRFGNSTTASSQQCVEDCGCSDITCATQDPYCTSTGSNSTTSSFASGSHLIKVQFRVVDYHPDHWERVFGVEFSNSAGNPEYATTSSIDAVIFNTSPDSKYTRLQGSANFQGKTEFDVTFAAALANASYSVVLTPNGNVNCWYEAKTTTGFKIKSELPFTGNVDWILMNNSGG